MQHGPDGHGFDAVQVEHLIGAELALGGEGPQRRGRVGAEDAHRVQHPVEAAAAVGAAHPVALQQFQLQAVPDGDVTDEAALGGHDGRCPAQRRPGHRRPGTGGRAPRGQLGETVSVTDPGQVGGQVVRGERGQQPAQAGADRVGADQQEQADPQVAGHRHRRPIPLAAGLQPVQGWPPPVGVAQLVGAAGHPPLLPRLPGLAGEPVHDRDHTPRASGPHRRVRERRRQDPGHQLVTVGAGAGPGRRNQPGRVTVMQPLHVRSGHPGRRHHLTDGGPARRHRRGRGHGAGLLNNVANDSGRYPLPGGCASPVAGGRPSGAVWAAWRRW